MLLKEAETKAMKGGNPGKGRTFNRSAELFYPGPHFLGGFIGESDGQYLIRAGDSRFYQVSDTKGQGSGLPCPGPGQNHQGASPMFDRLLL